MRFLAIFVFLTCLAGCNGEDAADGGKTDQPVPDKQDEAPPKIEPGAPSPDDAFNKLREALKKQDDRRLWLVSTTEARELLLAKALFEAHERTTAYGPDEEREKAIAEVLGPYELKLEQLNDPANHVQLAKDAKKPEELFVDLRRFVKQANVEDEIRVKAPQYSDLRGLEVKGDAATAECDEVVEERTVARLRVRFEKKDGRWFVKIG